MADHPQAMADLRSLLAAREPLYAVADHSIETRPCRWKPSCNRSSR
jgi:hypothetical protein